MKHLFILGAAATGLLLAACQKDEAAIEAQQPTATERLYLSDDATEAEAADPQSRAAFTEGYKIAWQAGDMVSVNATKAGGSRNECPVKQDEKGAWYVEAPKADIYRVVYPAIAGWEAEVDGQIIGNHVFLDDRNYQIYHENTFDPQRLVCYGQTAPGGKLTMRYMVALLKVTLQGSASERVTSLTVSANNGESIFASVGWCALGADGFPELTAGNTHYTSQTLRVEQADGVALDEQGVDFYIVLFPMTLTKGFSVQVDFSDGTSRSITAAKSVELKRGRILAMPPVWLGPTS